MKHDNLEDIINKLNIENAGEKLNKLYKYAEIIEESSEKINLTSFDGVPQILQDLIASSIKPMANNVLRGTRFADIGSGQGIPGIPISIIFENMNGILIDSNSRRVSFIEYVIDRLSLTNVTALYGRVEDVARNSRYREKFDLVFARAMAKLYVVIEVGSPLVRPDGLLYVYSNKGIDFRNHRLVSHYKNLNLNYEKSDAISTHEGILFKKLGSADGMYPRRYAQILRESRQIGE